MKNKRVAYILMGIACCFILVFVLFQVLKSSMQSSPFLIISLALLAISVRAFPLFKGLSYSIWIFAAVAISMFYPQYFLSVGTFQLNVLIVPLLQIIMFGMGSQMSLKDFAGVVKMPKGVIAGVICQFTIMPIVGITLATLFKFPPEIAAGIILVGSSPSGMASNVMSFLAKANLALSITLTAFATMLSPLLTPLLMRLFANEFVEINFWNMMLDIFNMVILPIVGGFVFNLFIQKTKDQKRTILQLLLFVLIIAIKNIVALVVGNVEQGAFFHVLVKDLLFFFVLPLLGAQMFQRWAKGGKAMLEKALSFISMLGIAIIITIITAAGRDSLMEVGLLLILVCLLQNIFGYTLGYSVAKLLRLPEKDCRTIALEVGMQNGGMVSGLAMQMGKIASVGLAPAIFGPMMNITGSSLATWWRGKKTIE